MTVKEARALYDELRKVFEDEGAAGRSADRTPWYKREPHAATCRAGSGFCESVDVFLFGPRGGL